MELLDIGMKGQQTNCLYLRVFTAPPLSHFRQAGENSVAIGSVDDKMELEAFLICGPRKCIIQ